MHLAPKCLAFPWWSFRHGAPTHFVIFLIHLCCREPVGVNVLLPQAAAQGGEKRKGKGKRRKKKKKEERFVQIEADEPQGVLL